MGLTGTCRLAEAKKAKNEGAFSMTDSMTDRAETKSQSRRSGKLVIVESPAKARTVGRFLGKGYTVKASVGHVRDLLRSRLSVDVDKDFEPTYRVPNEKRAVVKELRQAAAKAKEVYLATDPDREGEAIAWHLLHAAEMAPETVKRVVFHEITATAIQEAFSHPRQINTQLVNAQQARRILDRLVGYGLTELLWDRVRNRLSAGRVQSVAVRLVVEREKEIRAFVPQEYWTLDAELSKAKQKKNFLARLVKIGEQDPHFQQEGHLRPHLTQLESSRYQVQEIKRGQRQRRPSAPFTTSTLQQEASKVMNYSASKTMSIAQQLYEGIELKDGLIGLITYMRTDSTSVSKEAQAAAQNYIRAQFGPDYLPETPPQYKTKTRGAQEAHEAIRPTDVNRNPDSLKNELSRDQFRLYTLIWKRFLASQMNSAIYNTLRVDIAAGPDEKNQPYLFRASGSTVHFKGFLAVYEEAADEDQDPDNPTDEGRTFPEMEVGEWLQLHRLRPEQHFTQAPPRYTEASLVRALEEQGIGRPSTYAPTMAVIQDRDYVTRQEKRLVPTETGMVVTELLTQYFPEVMNLDFTATMEDKLDDIADGHAEWVPVLRNFYTSFEAHLQMAEAEMPRLTKEETIGRICPECGQAELIIRYGRWGKFIGCQRYPDCRYTEQWKELIGVPCRVCGEGEIVALRSKSGRVFFGCTNYKREQPESGCQFTSWKRPLKTPCPVCQGILVLRNKSQAECLTCSTVQELSHLPEEGLAAALESEEGLIEEAAD
jgi:DNA topoisomerase-1